MKKFCGHGSAAGAGATFDLASASPPELPLVDSFSKAKIFEFLNVKKKTFKRERKMNDKTFSIKHN